MHPVILKIGSLTVYSYGFMLSLAFLSGLLVSVYLGAKQKIDPEAIIDIVIWVILSAIAGARMAYVLFFWPEFEGNILSVFMIQNGGLVFYGGFILATLVIIWKSRAFKLSLLRLLDMAAPSAALGYSIARIGCFLNGCCYGIETHVPWAVQFPLLIGHRHPTQLYASMTVFVFFILLLYLWHKRKYDGQVFLLAVFLYSAYRFAIEFIREGPRLLLGLTSAQLFSIVLFVLAGGTLIWKATRK